MAHEAIVVTTIRLPEVANFHKRIAGIGAEHASGRVALPPIYSKPAAYLWAVIVRLITSLQMNAV